MVKKTEVLAIVMARGGSKGIPGKNLKRLEGHPLIAYSITSGLAAESIDRMIVSTDDDDIAEISKKYGAEIPFIRPAEFAQDDTLDFPVIEHALQWLGEHEDYHPDMIVQLRPTSPLRPKGLIDKSIELLLENPEADCIRGVTSPKQNPYKMWKKGIDGYLKPLVPSQFHEPFNMPRQQLPACYWQTGHIDVIRSETVLKKKSLTGENILPAYIESKYCIDIDSHDDIKIAERIISMGNLDIDRPGIINEKSFKNISLLVMDFDGVLTDNRVFVMEDGKEAVVCDRSDGMGLSLLREHGLDAIILSKEQNPVVSVRGEKLKLTVYQGIDEKLEVLKRIIYEKGVGLENVIYVGNDINDLACMKNTGISVAVADAYPEVKKQANILLNHNGGQGAIREVCELIIKNKKGKLK